MRLPLPRRAACLLLASLRALASAVDPAEPIGIGAGEGDKAHLHFETERGARIVKVSTRVVIDKVAPKGLNFFAIQVNFPNHTWAHGGPQVNGPAGHLVRYANWGGLVNRGGGSRDYTQADPKNDFNLIECGIGQPNTAPWEWRQDCEYILTVERGRRVDLPAGLYGPRRDVQLGPRTMWEWKLTIVPAAISPDVGSFSSLLYDSADFVSWFCVWNESGYGSSSGEQHARWSVPTYWTEDDPRGKTPTRWARQ